MVTARTIILLDGAFTFLLPRGFVIRGCRGLGSEACTQFPLDMVALANSVWSLSWDVVGRQRIVRQGKCACDNSSSLGSPVQVGKGDGMSGAGGTCDAEFGDVESVWNLEIRGLATVCHSGSGCGTSGASVTGVTLE